MSESDKSFSFMDVAIFDFTLVTVAVVSVKEYGLDTHCTFIQTVFKTIVSCCVNGTFRDLHL